jgi:hypothetical protein
MIEIADDGVCRMCGCTARRGCEGGCIWATPDLCSRCALDPEREDLAGLAEEDLEGFQDYDPESSEIW